MKVQKSKLIKIIRDRRQNLRYNTHGCELIITFQTLNFVQKIALFF